jgi:hypothetical protein
MYFTPLPSPLPPFSPSSSLQPPTSKFLATTIVNFILGPVISRGPLYVGNKIAIDLRRFLTT